MGSGLPGVPDNLIDIIQLLFSASQRKFWLYEHATGLAYLFTGAIAHKINRADTIAGKSAPVKTRRSCGGICLLSYKLVAEGDVSIDRVQPME